MSQFSRRAILAAAPFVFASLSAAADEPVRRVAPPMRDEAAAAAIGRAVLAGGCFWGVEGVFQHVRGVRQVRSGYSGGGATEARYDLVSAGGTQHAEAVEILFQPREISYGRLLQVFFSVAHDPTQLNRQGPDHGRQYRSHIFTLGEQQSATARAYITQLQTGRAFSRPIVTRVDPLAAFYPAEDYHQNFLSRNLQHPYIRIHDAPKLAALRRLFPELWRAQPAA